MASNAPYEVRQGQIDLARCVDEGMCTDRHVLAEAPCGIGKGFAYAVPAIFHAISHGTTTVIATANIALQTQLIRDDLPFLKKALPWDFTYDFIKGRGNYACKYKIDQLELLREIAGPIGSAAWDNYGLDQADGMMLNALLAWSDVTETGDREDPGCPAGTSPVWSKISVGVNECHRHGCSFYDDCWAEKHRERARSAHIIVTNYNLLYAHLATLYSGRSTVLPPFNYLIMDEAHEAVRIARDFFGSTLSYRRFRILANFIETEMGLTASAKQLMQDVSQLLTDASYYTTTTEYKQQQRLTQNHAIDHQPVKATLSGIVGQLDSAMRELRRAYEVNKRDHVIAKKCVTTDVMHDRATKILVDVQEAFEAQLDDHVYWIEVQDRVGAPARIEKRPLDVSTILRTHLFEAIPSVTLTSATLTTGGTFNLIKAEVGLTDSDPIEMVAPSPFNFSRHSRLVVGSKLLPVPRSQNRQLYNEAVLPVYYDVLDTWSGRVLCLFTANTDLAYVYEHLAKRYPNRQLFKQGDWPRNTLVDWFRQNDTSVLLGVDSFWTGVDVAEPKAIILHKLPFPRFDNVVRAIQAQMGDTFFNDRYLPWMLTRLRQGVGRLIRRQGDYGFVVCLDRRGFDSRYAPAVRASLPFGPAWVRTDRFDMVGKFLSNQAKSI
jgi:ATP-dependent DNA helicase DinG